MSKDLSKDQLPLDTPPAGKGQFLIYEAEDGVVLQHNCDNYLTIKIK